MRCRVRRGVDRARQAVAEAPLPCLRQEVRSRRPAAIASDGDRLVGCLGGCGSDRRHIRKLLHAGDEAISLTRNGDYVVMLVWALVECSPKGRNLTRQVVLVDGGVRPDAVQKLIFPNDVVPMSSSMTSTSKVFGEIGTRRPCRQNLRLTGSTTNGPKAYPSMFP